MTETETAAPRPWIIMPVLAHRDYTIAAIADCLAQTRAHRLLIVNQGVDSAFREELERTADAADDRILVWSHVPPMLSLSATWNRALRAAWEAGAEACLVVNNDVRLHPRTLEILTVALVWSKALFVSCVGVRAEQYDPQAVYDLNEWAALIDKGTLSKGGPDFSCFLITRECHTRYPFDENFIPAFCEDLDYHRRLMLGGDGARIFSVNLPYLHYASATLKALDPAEANRIRHDIEAKSRAYYARKWGGAVNQERFAVPFLQDGTSGWNDGRAATPELQRRVAAGLPPIGCPSHDDQPADDCQTCAVEAEVYDLAEMEEHVKQLHREGHEDQDHL